MSGNFYIFQELLKVSTFTISVFRNIFHILTTTAATYLLIDYNFPCQTGGGFCLVGENWTGISLGIVFFYFLVDIVSLP